jgi:hypothetical protein
LKLPLRQHLGFGFKANPEAKLASLNRFNNGQERGAVVLQSDEVAAVKNH